MKILVLSVPRSGSSYLCSVLTNTVFSNYVYLNEPFMAVDDNNLQNIKSDWQNKIHQIEQDNNIIVKVHLHHLEQMDKIDLLEDFKNVQFDKVYAIFRQDTFESALSLTISGITGSWYKDDHNQTQIEIPEDVFLNNVDFIKEHTDNLIQNKFDFDIELLIEYSQLSFDRLQDLKLLGYTYDDNVLELLSPGKFRDKSALVKNYNQLKVLYDSYE